VVTIVFPATEEPDPNTQIPIGSPSVKLYLDGSQTALTHNGTTPVSRGSGTCTVSIASGLYTEIIWYLNGTKFAEGPGKTSIVLSKQTAGNYLVTVEAQPEGGSKNSGAHTFTMQ
jgi:hypothetical protein